MRILGFRIGHGVFGDCAAPGIELADQGGGVARVPDVAILILHQTMRSGMRCLERVLLDLTRLRIDAPENVGHLAAVPERALPCSQRIVGPRAWRRRWP